MKTLLSALGALLLALIGIVGTTSPGDATSNVAGWAEWAGINRIPGFLRGAAADRLFQFVAVIAITVLLSSWWHRRKAHKAQDIQPLGKVPSDYRLSERMERMADRLRHNRDREWWDKDDPNEEVIADLDALGLTLTKAGFKLPYPPADTEPNAGLNVFIEYMLQVGALLRDGHGREARIRAEQIAARYPSQE